MDKLTSGQMAKAYHSTIRSVQYYVKENLLKPSVISEGGRRLYTQEDLTTLKTICLYKNLGFSLDEIKQAILYEDASQMVHLIQEKRSSLQTTMKEIQRKEQELSVLEEVVDHQHMSIACIEQLQELLLKKYSFKKGKKQIYIALFTYVIALVLLVFMA